MTTPIAIDTDPGVDDAIALILAMRSPELRVELITTVAGNVPVATGTRNAKRLVGLVDPRTWPALAQGAARPLAGRLHTAASVHHRDGLGGHASALPVPRRLRSRSDAVDALIRFARTHGSDGVVIALGPLTNIARAIARAPRVMAGLGRLIVMGGAVRVPGNMNAVAEFNIFVDPVAADRVLAAGLRTALVPLDVTRQVRLTRSRLAAAGRGKVAQAAKRITLKAATKFDGMPMHDALAVALAIDPEMVGTEALSLRVETRGEHTRGMTVADLRAGAAPSASTIDVATTVDAERMLSLLDERVLHTSTPSKRHRRGKVVVVGSANMDLSIVVPALPVAGETVLGDSMEQALGGKGANQAVAARRAGAEVDLIARLGKDRFGDEWLRFLERTDIDAGGCSRDDVAGTGVATITVSKTGENQIAVASGANARFTPEHLEPILQRIGEADVLVTQLEIPSATVELAMRTARAQGVTTVHNPAPAQSLDAAFLELIDVLVCNEVEAALLTGRPVRKVDEAKLAAMALHSRGVERVVITLGRNGLVYLEPGRRRPARIAGRRAKAIDTTGAGDTFVGYLAAALAEGLALAAALELANKAAALSVTRRGAVPAIPYRSKIA